MLEAGQEHVSRSRPPCEGVDRNRDAILQQMNQTKVALHVRAWIEIAAPKNIPNVSGSPSMRRAWIEIIAIIAALKIRFVALHAEGVDRNCLRLE